MLGMIRRHFDHILKRCGLKASSTGNSRTLITAPHVSQFFGALNGHDILSLAQNSRTSITMLQNYYVSALVTERTLMGNWGLEA
jgi:hypothetical protein